MQRGGKEGKGEGGDENLGETSAFFFCRVFFCWSPQGVGMGVGFDPLFARKKEKLGQTFLSLRKKRGVKKTPSCLCTTIIDPVGNPLPSFHFTYFLKIFE